MDEVARPRSSGASAAWTAAGLVIAVCLLATFTLHSPTGGGTTVRNGAPGDDPLTISEGEEAAGPGEPGAEGSAPGDGGGPGGPGGTRSGSNAIPGAKGVDASKYDCAKGQNAGATEVGVTAKEIRFAATVVKTGVGASFLKDAEYGIEAVTQKVNRAGGICGRLIKVDYKDDGWNSDQGTRLIESFIGEKKYFGLVVNPSSEGLRGAIESGIIRRNKFPVIGSDGQLISQYTDPWVWPVATSTASVMHVVADNAFARGARKVGIVSDSHYRFGVEGREAFKGAIKRLGGTVTSDVPVDGNKGDFSNEAKQFIDGCGGTSFGNCDFIAVLLEPAAAETWVKNGGLGDGKNKPRFGIGVPQPLFVTSFASNCRGYCANMWAWTSFNPPIPPFDTNPAVATYKSDLANVSSSADATNPHVQGAYVGTLLLVEALTRLGPAPTREGVRAVLDAMTFETGLAPPIKFSPGNHYGNTGAQAFEDIVSGGDANASFANWRYTNSGFLFDREVGKDVVD